MDLELPKFEYILSKILGGTISEIKSLTLIFPVEISCNTVSKFLFLSTEHKIWGNQFPFVHSYDHNDQDHMNMKPESLILFIKICSGNI